MSLDLGILGRLDGQTDRCYQAYYLPCFTVDNNLPTRNYELPYRHGQPTKTYDSTTENFTLCLSNRSIRLVFAKAAPGV